MAVFALCCGLSNNDGARGTSHPLFRANPFGAVPLTAIVILPGLHTEQDASDFSIRATWDVICSAT